MFYGLNRNILFPTYAVHSDEEDSSNAQFKV